MTETEKRRMMEKNRINLLKCEEKLKELEYIIAHEYIHFIINPAGYELIVDLTLKSSYLAPQKYGIDLKYDLQKFEEEVRKYLETVVKNQYHEEKGQEKSNSINQNNTILINYFIDLSNSNQKPTDFVISLINFLREYEPVLLKCIVPFIVDYEFRILSDGKLPTIIETQSEEIFKSTLKKAANPISPLQSTKTYAEIIEKFNNLLPEPLTVRYPNYSEKELTKIINDNCSDEEREIFYERYDKYLVPFLLYTDPGYLCSLSQEKQDCLKTILDRLDSILNKTVEHVELPYEQLSMEDIKPKVSEKNMPDNSIPEVIKIVIPETEILTENANKIEKSAKQSSQVSESKVSKDEKYTQEASKNAKSIKNESTSDSTEHSSISILSKPESKEPEKPKPILTQQEPKSDNITLKNSNKLYLDIMQHLDTSAFKTLQNILPGIDIFKLIIVQMVTGSINGEHYTVSDISQIFNIPEENIKSEIMQIKQALEQNINILTFYQNLLNNSLDSSVEKESLNQGSKRNLKK